MRKRESIQAESYEEGKKQQTLEDFQEESSQKLSTTEKKE